MLFQNRYNTIQLAPTDSSGAPVDASTLTAADYTIYDCNKVAQVNKALGSGLDVVVLDGNNILQCVITPDECKKLCGRVTHELKVALVDSDWLGVQLATTQITFTPTRG
jgi:hypothetical protein